MTAVIPPPLSALLQRRREVLAETQASLASCLYAEAQAETLACGIEREIGLRTEMAADPGSSDADVEAFGEWFKAEWQRLERMRRRLENLQAETARVRAVLNACKLALERVERRAGDAVAARS